MSYAYDKLNRITNRTVTNGTTYSAAYTYVPGSSTYGANATTPLVAAITQGSGANAMNFAYTYDNHGNILNKSAYVYTTGTVGTIPMTN